MKDELIKITTFDKILRELGIIENIFAAPFKKYDKTNPFPPFFIMDENGKSGMDGRYIASISLRSNVELFNLQKYKAEFTERFENAKDNTLLKSQLLEIYEKAIKVRDYFNDNLTNECKIRIDYLKASKLPPIKWHEKSKDYETIITISDYYINGIYFNNGNQIHTKEYEFSYVAFLYTLASICQSFIDFIAKFNLRGPGTDAIASSFTLLHKVFTKDCYNTLKNHNFINEETKESDFRKIFSGQEIKNKIDWIGSVPELSRFAYLLHTDYAKDGNNAVCKPIDTWPLVTCKCFTHNGEEIKAGIFSNNNRGPLSKKGKARHVYLLNAIKNLK